MKHFHLAVEAVNTKLVEEFETGSDPANVSRRVGETLVPAIHVLQARTNKTPGGRDASLLEEVMIYNIGGFTQCVDIYENIQIVGERALVCHDRAATIRQEEGLLGHYISNSDAR